MRHPMECHITDLPDDRTEYSDEEVWMVTGDA